MIEDQKTEQPQQPQMPEWSEVIRVHQRQVASNMFGQLRNARILVETVNLLQEDKVQLLQEVIALGETLEEKIK